MKYLGRQGGITGEVSVEAGRKYGGSTWGGREEVRVK